MPKLKASAPAIVAAASNSGNVPTAFIRGRNVFKASDEAAAELMTDNAAVQEAKVRDLKIGMISTYCAKREEGWNGLTDVEAYDKAKDILAMTHKAREANDTWRKAEKSSRVEITRLFAKYEIKNLNPKGGSNALTAEERKAKKEAQRIESAKKLLGLTEIVKPQEQVQLAAFVIPNFEAAADFKQHVHIVSKGLKDSLAKAMSVLTAKQEKVIRQKLATALTKLSEIERLLEA